MSQEALNERIEREIEAVRKRFPHLFGGLEGLPSKELDDFIALNIDRIYNPRKHGKNPFDLRPLFDLLSGKTAQKESYQFPQEPRNIIDSFLLTLMNNVPNLITGFVEYPHQQPQTAKQWREIVAFFERDYYPQIQAVVDSQISLRQILSIHPGFHFSLEPILDLEFKIGDLMKYEVDKRLEARGVNFNAAAQIRFNGASREHESPYLYFFHVDENARISFAREQHISRIDDLIRYEGFAAKDPFSLRLSNFIRAYGEIRKKLENGETLYIPDSRLFYHTGPINLTLTLVKVLFYQELDRRIGLLKEGKKGSDDIIRVESGPIILNNPENYPSAFEQEIVASWGGDYQTNLVEEIPRAYQLYEQAMGIGRTDEAQTHFRRVEELYGMLPFEIKEAYQIRPKIVELETALQAERKRLESSYGYKGSSNKYLFAKSGQLENFDMEQLFREINAFLRNR